MRVILGKVAKVMVVLVLGVSGVLFGGVSDVDASTKRNPTFFIHGFDGHSESMVDAISYTSGVKKQSAYNLVVVVGSGKSKKEHTVKIVPSGQRMVYIVDPAGKLISHRVLYKSGTKGIRDDLIQVVFVNNMAPISNQEKWLDSVLYKSVGSKGNLDFNIVGHSMGGLLGANFLIKDNTSGKKHNLKKLVTVGSPLTGSRDFNKLKASYKPKSRAAGLLFEEALKSTALTNDLKNGGFVGDFIRKGKRLNTKATVISISYKDSGWGDSGDDIVGGSSTYALAKVLSSDYYKSMKLTNIKGEPIRRHTSYFKHYQVNETINQIIDNGKLAVFK